MSGPAGLTALVLAGSRGGRPDPMALEAGVSHKALLLVDGTTMLERVLCALRACPGIGRIVVSAEQAEALLAPLHGRLPAAVGGMPDVLGREASASPSRSLAAVLEEFGTPLLVTTADHALLTPAMLSHVLSRAPASDIVAAVARSEVVLTAYPGTRRTWLRFRDGRFSGCNLFLLRTGRALRVVNFWSRLERRRKQPLAMAWLIGPVSLIAYTLRLATLAGMLRRLGRRIGADLAVVEMPFADAAIDVDKPDDLRLVREIVARRAAEGDGSIG